VIPVATAEQVRALDAGAIEGLGIPGIALMESASQALAAAVQEVRQQVGGGSVLLVCGGGNNGGDGFGAARWLHGWGVPVVIWALSDRASGDAAVNRQACERLGLPFVSIGSPGELAEHAVLVDAVFGTGLSRDVEGRYATVLTWLDQAEAPIVAADLPSGLHADTGRLMGVGVHAARTVTFGALKAGMLCGQGPERCGQVDLAELGLGAVPDVELLGALGTPQTLRTWWPHRGGDAHKTRSGHVAVLAGSTAMAGAAVLCCRGAQAAGAGLVTLFAPRGALPRLACLPPEVMVAVSGEGDVLEAPDLDGPLSRATALVAGPGLGGGQELPPDLARFLAERWAVDPRPMLADADALSVVFSASAAVSAERGPRVITPHPGEAARLLDTDAPSVQGDRFDAVQRLAALGSGCTALLKGRHTLIATPDQPVHVNPTGGPVLATGGTGDVLSGLVTALLGRGLPAHRAATLGAWVHGRAGDRLAEVPGGGEGTTAGDVADALSGAIAELLDPSGAEA